MSSVATIPRSAAHAIDRWFPVPRLLLPAGAGVDISDSSIKWLTLAEEKEHKRVVAWGSQPLAAGIVEGGAVQNVKALGEALAQVRERLGSHAAHASLPEEAAYVFGMQVPLQSDRVHILNLIEFEFDGRVPIAPSAAVYDFDHIGISGESKEISVTVFPREIAQQYADAFAAAGIELLSLEVEAQSIARAITPRTSAAIDLIVDFGLARTGFAVVKCGVPIFTSTVDVGGKTMFEALERMFGFTHEEAQHYGNYEGLSHASGPRSGIEAMLPTISALADEIERHFRYWDTRRNDYGERVSPVGRIVLLGGTANTRGLAAYIAGRLHAPVELANVWENVCSFDSYIPPIDARTSLQYATAIGLALRAF